MEGYDGPSTPVRPSIVQPQRRFTARSHRQAVERPRDWPAVVRALLDRTSDAIYLIDPETGRFLDVNETACRTLGYARAELLDMSVFDVDPDLDGAGYRRVQESLRSQTSLVLQRSHRRKSGSSFPVEIELGGVDIDRPYLTAVVRDITERQRAEEAAGRLEDQLRQAQKMDAVGQLSGGIAHDFSNILTVILANTALIESSPRLPADLLDAVREVGHSAERAASLTRQLMKLSRQQPMEARPLDLNDVVRTMTRLLERILGEDVRLRFTLAPEPLRVHADAGRIDQVLLNLAVNARDAMPLGGQLTIETFAVELREAMREGAFAGVRVIDTGGGIAPEVVPHVFEPYFTTKDVGKGTGFGLATVSSIIQQHNGWINVESSPGTGTVFTFFLPRLGMDARPGARPPDTQVVPGGRETILVVEDEPPLRSLVANLLIQNGYTVLEAPSGMTALDVWTRHRHEIQLLLTDVVMPDGMSGLELAQRLRRDRPDLRVIYTSGYSAEIAERAIPLQEGFNFLPKPYRAPELLRTVRANLDAK